MGLNPFKNSNLNDLQQNIEVYLSDHFDGIQTKIKDLWAIFLKKGRERITLMFIPHSEKKIINFHISIFTIAFFTISIATTITITSVMIINHSSTIKEVSKLKKYGKNSKIQVQKYKEEINKLYTLFQQFKPEITHLYSLTPGSRIDSLWAKGGAKDPQIQKEAIKADTEHNTTGSITSHEEINTPPIELLNIEEIKTELYTTKKILVKIKKFLKYRKKIITHTPSIWPTEGYIVSRFGQRVSPFTFQPQFHHGIDIESFPGAEIKAAAPGKIVSIRWDNNLGLTISIKHKYGFTTSYSHCQRASIKMGQSVKKGEVIGYVGKTGKTTHYICFYQIKIGTEFVDPMPYLNRIIK